MKNLLTFLLILASASTSLCWNYDPIRFSGCVISIGGKDYNRQVFIEKDGKTHAITHFKPWETVDQIVLSPDEKRLLISHRGNKAPKYELSVLEMSTFTITNSVAPGFGGELFWTKSGNVLLEWGCGTECANFRLYDSSLVQIVDNRWTFGLRESIDDDVVFTVPASGGESVVRIWSLSSGRLLAMKDYSLEYKYAYCESYSIKDSVLIARLNVKESDSDSVVTVKIPFQR
jgi:hypothetical protein